MLISSFLSAQNIKTNTPWANGQSSAENLQISLITFGPGETLTDWWGHTALVVKDTTLDISRVYNFGYFSFDEGFISRFAMGRLIFWAGENSLAATIAVYVRAKRTIIIQELNIPLKKRIELARKLADAVLPENSRYLYHHYHENCATRLRDYIDASVGGQFADSMKTKGRLTFREHTLRYTAHQPFMQWLLMFLMNDTIDKQIFKWDEMFLPDELSKYVANAVFIDSSGARQSVVSHGYTYYESEKKKVPFNASNTPLWSVLSGLILTGLTIGLAQWASNGQKLSRVIFLVYNSIISLFLGIIGSVLFFMSLFTDHLVTHGNENLFLANPITLFIFFLTLILFFKKSDKLWGYLKLLWMVLAGSSLLLMILKLLPLFDQDNYMIMFFLLPVNVAFAAGHFLFSGSYLRLK